MSEWICSNCGREYDQQWPACPNCRIGQIEAKKAVSDDNLRAVILKLIKAFGPDEARYEVEKIDQRRGDVRASQVFQEALKDLKEG